MRTIRHTNYYTIFITKKMKKIIAYVDDQEDNHHKLYTNFDNLFGLKKKVISLEIP